MLKKDGVIVVETLKDYQMIEKIGNIIIEKEVTYGISKISYYRWRD